MRITYDPWADAVSMNPRNQEFTSQALKSHTGWTYTDVDGDTSCIRGRLRVKRS